MSVGACLCGDEVYKATPFSISKSADEAFLLSGTPAVTTRKKGSARSVAIAHGHEGMHRDEPGCVPDA